jgi:hypothetical protein
MKLQIEDWVLCQHDDEGKWWIEHKHTRTEPKRHMEAPGVVIGSTFIYCGWCEIEAPSDVMVTWGLINAPNKR